MNALVAALCVALVAGGALYYAHTLLGQWSTLLWVLLGWLAFIGLCKRANA